MGRLWSARAPVMLFSTSIANYDEAAENYESNFTSNTDINGCPRFMQQEAMQLLASASGREASQVTSRPGSVLLRPCPAPQTPPPLPCGSCHTCWAVEHRSRTQAHSHCRFKVSGLPAVCSPASFPRPALTFLYRNAEVHRLDRRRARAGAWAQPGCGARKRFQL